ncbi:MAG: T9SS type A sorting domain-containing protein [Vicingus serpentipes]|nr:T9SS type A sorting domain-containing protein [Vicingus serpentipes]
MRKNIFILFAIGTSLCGMAQTNLDFEYWVNNYNGIDEAKHWLNTSDASEYNAPQTMFKEQRLSDQGNYAIRLTTAYWKEGAQYGVDTLPGSIVQQFEYHQQPEIFTFDYQSYPQQGDAVLIGIQLSMTVNDSDIIVGEGFFTSAEVQESWKNQEVAIHYYSGFTPEKVSIIALSSANAVLRDNSRGNVKIGSTLLLDNIVLGVKIQEKKPKYYMYVFPNPVKSYINIETNDPRAKSIQIYNLEGKLVLSHPVFQKERLKIDLSSLSKGTYVYKVLGEETVITSNKFNIVR